MKEVKHSIGNFATKIFLYPISFVTSVIISRYLGPSEKGIYSFMLLIISFFIPFFSFGLGSGIVYYLSNKKYKIENVIFTTFLIGTLLGILYGVILYNLWSFSLLGKTGNKISSVQILVLSFSLILNTIMFFLSRLFFGISEFPKLNILDIIRGTFNPILLLIFVWLLALRINGAVLTILIVNVLGLTYLLFITIRKYKIHFIFNFFFIKEAFIYGLKGWLGDISLRANVRLDQIILGVFVSSKSLGIYSIAVLLSELLWLIPDSIGPVLFTKIAGTSNKDKQIILTTKIHSLIFYFILLIAFLFSFISIFIVIPKFYGVAYIDAIKPFLILIPGTILMVSTKILSKFFSGIGDIIITTKVQTISSIASIILYLILIPFIGMLGAALASTIGYIIGMILSLYFFNRKYHQSIVSLFIINKKNISWGYNMLMEKKP